jgi:hypothetical protein
LLPEHRLSHRGSSGQPLALSGWDAPSCRLLLLHRPNRTAPGDISSPPPFLFLFPRTPLLILSTDIYQALVLCWAPCSSRGHSHEQPLLSGCLRSGSGGWGTVTLSVSVRTLCNTAEGDPFCWGGKTEQRKEGRASAALVGKVLSKQTLRKQAGRYGGKSYPGSRSW